MPTLLGLIVLMIGLATFVLGRLTAVFALCMCCTLMGGSAALSLGSSSILPIFAVLPFLAARMLMPGAGQMDHVRDAIRSNALLLVFAAYALGTAYILPNLFKHQIELVPLKAVKSHLLSTSPLAFSSQNITTPVYIAGSALIAILSFVAARQAQAWRTVSKFAVIIVAIHCFFGIAGVALGSTPFGLVIQFFRNGNYAQLDQNIGGFVRISGIFPEPSAFATYGLAWFVFAAELWLRNIRRFWTGCAALLMGAVLVASTSSTAYVGLAVYLVTLMVRVALVRHTISSGKLLVVMVAGWTGITAILLLMATYPAFAAKLGSVLREVTLHKSESKSGEGRLMFAEQGFAAWAISYGLGVGAGSFRSSSIATAILGSTGTIGAIAYLCYLLHVWKPLRRSTFEEASDPARSVGAAASWVTMVSMAAASVSASSPDPGPVIGMFAGLALGFRSKPSTKRQPVPSHLPAATLA